MAISNLTTPGVYIQEIPTLPSSVVAVATAVPAFFGYTEKGPINTPVRVTSMIEFQANFGNAYREMYTAKINTDGSVELDPAPVDSPYTLFYHMQMFFGNGGGPCYVISVGYYDYSVPVPSITINSTDFYDPSDPTIGIGAAEQVDEVTLLIAPEIAEIPKTSNSLSKAVYDAMLVQCNKLKDRFCVFDVKTSSPLSVTGDADNFRDFQIGANNLKYGAAYYPPLDTILGHHYSDDDVVINDTRLTPVYTADPNKRLSTVHGGVGTYIQLEISQTGTAPVASPVADIMSITIGSTTAIFTCGVDFPPIPATNEEIAAAIVNSINNHPVLSPLVRAEEKANPNEEFFYVVSRVGSNSTIISASSATWITPQAGGTGIDNSQNTGIYSAIKSLLDARRLTLYPAATMGGIYAAVDNDRGVWKAPANVSVANIVGPDFPITEEQQGYLNVDAASGKSIDAIRTFVGRGTLVWGARTLAGNDNEWRYVPVRRLFIMVEESVKKATEFVVFEPNDANTWLRVKGLIGNFLNDLWQQGALAGAKPEQAYFVRVGLGETMTPQDILEGRMIVTIGLAAVRPAEFIILNFEHKLQEA